MTTLSKRGLLLTLSGLAAVSMTGVANTSAARTPALAAIDEVGATEIGRAWLALHPESTAVLRATVFPKGQENASPDLAQRVRVDFRNGALFSHKGWFLSETEARLCALIALG